MNISYAPEAWKLLNGVFCIYKPSGVHVSIVRNAILQNLCKDLNAMKVRPPCEVVQIEGKASNGNLTVTSVPSVADNPLVVGPRYQEEDIKLASVVAMNKFTSGLCVVAINDGCRFLKPLRENRYLRVFEVTGEFGYATDNFQKDGKILEKTTYDHINRIYIDRILASWQATHQREMFKYAGVDPQSQAAFELAAKGPIRPADKSVPIIYSIKCLQFEPPEFTLEIQCVNEDQIYLRQLVFELGLALKSTATCTKLRQVRFGYFTLDMALLRKHWTLQHIINAIDHCKHLTDRQHLRSINAHLHEAKNPTKTVNT